MIEWDLVSMLSGATIAILASFVYSTLTNAYLSGGRFRSKEEALFIYLTTASILAFLTPIIESIWFQIIQVLALLKILGLLIVIGNSVIHQSVKRWKHTSPKSLAIYLIRILLFFIG